MPIEMRKGKGRPVKRRQFNFVDEWDRTIFSLWSSDLTYYDKPKTHKHLGYRKFLNLKRLQVTSGGSEEKLAIAIFSGVLPVRKVLEKWEIEALHGALHRAYWYLYRKKLVNRNAKRKDNRKTGIWRKVS